MTVVNFLWLAGSNSRWSTAPDREAGFWAGLWHGWLVVFAFIVSLFASGVSIYERSNRGALYDLGFVVGVCVDITLLTIRLPL